MGIKLSVLFPQTIKWLHKTYLLLHVCTLGNNSNVCCGWLTA